MGVVPGVIQLRVSEVFGPVWQGEGPAAGRRAWFLRLGLCNLHCSWCDTPYTWDATRYDLQAENPPASGPEIIGRFVGATAHDILVLTGGEPLVWQFNTDLSAILSAFPGPVHVETNGTRRPAHWLLKRLSGAAVSPKLAPQGDPADRRVVPAVIRAWAGVPYAILKIVCITSADVYEAGKFAAEHGFTGRLWIMPEGTSADTLLTRARALAPAVTEIGAHLTLRQQVLLYGGRRAV